MRDLRAWFLAVRVAVWRMRFRADAVLAMFVRSQRYGADLSPGLIVQARSAEDGRSKQASNVSQGAEIQLQRDDENRIVS
jgi:hypothetical protein